jgi:hypothetical protein
MVWLSLQSISLPSKITTMHPSFYLSFLTAYYSGKSEHTLERYLFIDAIGVQSRGVSCLQSTILRAAYDSTTFVASRKCLDDRVTTMYDAEVDALW